METLKQQNGGSIDQEVLLDAFRKDAAQAYRTREALLTPKVMRELERQVVLSVLDRKWREHLYEMDYLQEGIGLRAMGQRDPLVEYQKVAVLNGWKVEIINLSNSEGGGYKEIIASIVGRNVFSKLKFESGVHRVQRVPDTETQGRIHTSAATVAVLPEAEEAIGRSGQAPRRGHSGHGPMPAVEGPVDLAS